MNIKVFGNYNHLTYGNLRKKSEWAFQQLGHTIEEKNPEMILTFGTAAKWEELKEYRAKKIFLCHGVDWWRGFDTSENKIIKENWENCDAVVYSSRFAKHMAEKAFGKKDGEIVCNPGIADMPDTFPTWQKGETVHIATCAIIRAWKRIYEMERLVKIMNNKGQPTELHIIGKDGMKSHEEIKEIYKKCHFYLHLAFNDYSPATVGEAMGWGLPVMITNSGGSPDLVQNAGIILQTDPFIDYPFSIHREDILPKIDNNVFEEGFWEMMNNLSYYQQKNKDWVLKEANIIRQSEKLLKLYASISNYKETQRTRGMSGDDEMSPWITDFLNKYGNYVQEPILDIGGGDGNFVLHLKNQNKFAIDLDISEDAVKRSLEFKKVPIVLGDAQEKIPYPDKSFKTVTLFHSLEHFILPTKVIEEIDRILSGNLCVIVPKQKGWDEGHGHFSYFPNMESLKKLLPDFKVLIEEDLGNMLLIIANNA